SKEMFFAQALEIEGHEEMRVFVSVAAFLFATFGVAYSMRFVHDTFFGRGPRAVEHEVHEPPRFMQVPVAILVVACVAVGIAPQWTVGPTLETAARGVLGDALPVYSLAVWHGINTPLLMSLGGVVCGILLYLGLNRVLDLHAIVRQSQGRKLFHLNIEALFRLGRRFTHTVANGSMQRSLLWLVLVAIAAGAAPFIASWGEPRHETVFIGQPMVRLAWVLWLLLVACALGTLALYRHRLLAVLVMGGCGLAVSMTFVALSAPDLALTQLLVELVTVALMLLGLHYLPKDSPRPRSMPSRVRDVLVALVAGAGTGGLAWAMMTRPPANAVAAEITARALPEAWGSNIVNVILVDFRSFDTLAEITVFGIAGLTVHAMLRHARMAPEKVMPGPPIKLPVPADLAQMMFPLTLVVSIFLFLRGHNSPGGGFIAGLTLAVPLLIQYVIQGAASVESRFGFDYIRAIGLGLLVALAGGAGAMLFDMPFLSTGHYDLELPLLGTVALASALVFDLG